jgi:hypothetical protein
LLASAAVGGGLSILASSLALGTSVGLVVATVAHLAIISAHFQLVVYSMKNKTYGVSEAQLFYVLSLLVAQILISYVFVSGTTSNQSGN